MIVDLFVAHPFSPRAHLARPILINPLIVLRVLPPQKVGVFPCTRKDWSIAFGRFPVF